MDNGKQNVFDCIYAPEKGAFTLTPSLIIDNINTTIF